ncbi:MAG TPA: hypothetical protein VFA89_20825 [Terriglobales bacterium]|nr:hypothetical protein [Terriglobales bacterium]
MSGKRFRDFLLFAKVPVGAQDQFDGMGLKKAVALIRARRKALDRARKLYNGRSGAGLRAKLAATLRTWFHENLAIDKWDAFFWELFEVPAAMSEYRRHITAWWQIEVEGDWLKIIESTRPVPPPEPQGQDYAIFAYHRQWLASWYSRCAPITSVARSTLLLVREQLRKEQKEGRFPDGTKIGERFFKDHY